MTHDLSTEDMRTLGYMESYKGGLLFGGVFETGNDVVLAKLQTLGLIEAVSKPYVSGRAKYAGGYRITAAGLQAVKGPVAADIFKKRYPVGRPFSIDHDGFKGTIIGHYARLDGKRGVVGQQDGTNIVHVYGEKWLKS